MKNAVEIKSEVPEGAYILEDECAAYVRKRKEAWGSNLVGWIEKRGDYWYPCFNLYD